MPEDVEKVLKVDRYRTRNTDNMNTMIRLIATTALRNVEACGLKKPDIDWANL
jgi:integrase